MSPKLQRLFKRAGLMAGFFLLYIFAVRPLRALFTRNVVHRGIFSSETSTGNALEVAAETRSVLITYLAGGSEISVTYIPQFGFFFLFAMLGMIFFLPPKRFYRMLIGFQAAVELLVLILLWAGITVATLGFVLSGFLIEYLSPVGCLGFVVYLSIRNRHKPLLTLSGLQERRN